MLMPLLIFGSTVLFAKFLARKMPSGVWSFILSTALVAAYAILIGPACGIAFAPILSSADVPFGAALLSGITQGAIAAVCSPGFVWFSRRLPPQPVNTKLFDPFRGMPTYDKFGNPR
jgi:hypothetical protein